MLKQCEVCGQDFDSDAEWKTKCLTCYKKTAPPRESRVTDNDRIDMLADRVSLLERVNQKELDEYKSLIGK